MMFLRVGAVVAAMSLAVAALVQREGAESSTPRLREGGSATGAVAAPLAGGDLVAHHRCGACHADLPQPQPAAAPGPLSVPRVMAVLLEPGSGHLDFRLTEAEALAIALGVAADAAADRETDRLRRRMPEATPELGRQFAAALNCGGCHAGLPRSDAVGPVLATLAAGTRADWLRSFLRSPHAVRPFGTRPGSGGRMPDFGLDGEAADSITAWLMARADAADPVRRSAGGTSPGRLTARAEMGAVALLDLLSCRGCHSYGGRGGRIGPALDDVHRRRTPEYIAAIVTDPAGTVPGTTMPAIEDARIGLVIELLTAGPHDGSGADPAAEWSWLSPMDHALLPVDGTPYVRWCAACHGEAGRGDGFNARYLSTAPIDHTDASFVGERADDTLFDGIAAGGHAMGASPEMPPFGSTLDPRVVRELVGYLRSLCDCAAPAWAGGRDR